MVCGSWQSEAAENGDEGKGLQPHEVAHLDLRNESCVGKD
jgi:hypothetical protein